MHRNEKCFTFIWKISNIKFCDYKYSNIKSPRFFTHEIGATEWYLCLISNSFGFKNCFTCGIVSEDSKYALSQFEFDYEISILTLDGSVLQSEIFLKRLYKGGYKDWSSALYVKSDEVFISKKDMFITSDILTIRCRMWDSRYSISLSGRCLARTLFTIKSKFSFGVIKNFSRLKQNKKFPIFILSSSESVFSFLNLCVDADDKFAIEMKLKENRVGMYRYKIYILDNLGNKVKFGQSDVYDLDPHCVPLTLSKDHLVENGRLYLRNDVITMQFEIFYLKRWKKEIIYQTEYGFEYQDTLSLVSNASNSDIFSEKQEIENLTVLKDDLRSLFMEGILCDTKLKTATDIFPSHSVILSARSPVFKSMFTNDIKERTSCVEISDLDADTVRRMLLFMYSGNLEDLEYESAKSLYFAADKYRVVSLLQSCSNFLKQKLKQSNFCDILLLADIHQDKDLKNGVQDFIAKNGESVLLSDEWRNLQENDLQLTIETLRNVCLKNRGSQELTEIL